MEYNKKKNQQKRKMPQFYFHSAMTLHKIFIVPWILLHLIIEISRPKWNHMFIKCRIEIFSYPIF